MSDALPATTRIEAFSDAVIAIIITIMVLDLRLPKDSLAGGFWQGLVQPLFPKLVVYLLSFFVIAIIWIRHHLLLHGAPRATRALLWCNIHLLLWMSIIPLTTAILGDNPTLPLAIAVYGFVLAGNASAFLLLRWSIFRETRGDAAAKATHTAMLRRDAFVVVLYALSVPAAFASIYISIGIFVLMPGLFFLPDLLAAARGKTIRTTV